ncbi:MAG: hypothetical protein FWB76_07155 [Oscillospiraceae bacterium]|nr:hypothetical protein [Oscillospiraceae bacterium]
MAFEIIKTYKEHFPALRLIGKCYTDADRGADGSFSERWTEWHQNSWFDELKKAAKPSEDVENGCLGLMTINAKDHSNFIYWIGLFFPANTAVPDGFSYLDLPQSDVGISWIYGSDETGEIYGSEPHTACYQTLCDNGWNKLNEKAGGKNTLVFFERYNCPRMTTPDEKGNVILDYGFYLR